MKSESRDEYDRQLIKWVRGHYWDSLEKDKALILRHLRTFAKTEAPEPEDSCSHWWQYVNAAGGIWTCAKCKKMQKATE